jgi:hypothetical protein
MAMRPTLWARSFNHPPATPTNLSPVAGATVTVAKAILEASPFEDRDPGDTHAASQWEVAVPDDESKLKWRVVSNDISTLVPVRLMLEKQPGSRDLTQLSLDSQELDPIGFCYWRVAYQDSRERWTEFSEATSFCFEPASDGAKPAAAQPETIDSSEETARHVEVASPRTKPVLLVAGGVALLAVGVYGVVKLKYH